MLIMTLEEREQTGRFLSVFYAYQMACNYVQLHNRIEHTRCTKHSDELFNTKIVFSRGFHDF